MINRRGFFGAIAAAAVGAKVAPIHAASKTTVTFDIIYPRVEIDGRITALLDVDDQMSPKLRMINRAMGTLRKTYQPLIEELSSAVVVKQADAQG